LCLAVLFRVLPLDSNNCEAQPIKAEEGGVHHFIHARYYTTKNFVDNPNVPAYIQSCENNPSNHCQDLHEPRLRTRACRGLVAWNPNIITQK